MSVVAARVQGTAAEERARRLRLWIVLALYGAAMLVFWWAASRFFYKSPTGMFEDLATWLANILAALTNFEGGLLAWLGRVVVAVVDIAPLFTLVFIGGLTYRLYDWLRNEHPRPASANPLFDRHFRGIALEMILFSALAVFIWWITGNTMDNLVRLKGTGAAPGFDFLNSTAGFGINQILFLDYSETSSYGKALMVGLINTLVLSFSGIVLATIIGFIIGIMRLSHNWVISKLAAGYVEFFRNVPLLLQIFVWYNVVLKPLPMPRQSLVVADSIFLNNRGIYAPKPIFADEWWFVVAAFVFGLLASFLIARWARKRQMETGQPFPVLRAALALVVGLPVLVYFLVGQPMHFDFPHLSGFNFKGGMRIIPEFAAMLLALSIYTGAFIGEIVRAGIQAVPHGQTEAALSLGLTRGQMLRLVIIPQALRVIIPPLTSQYLNLTKNSSLAVAIAYPDLVAVGGIVLNQSGHELEVIAIWMLVYLSISLATSAFMNWYNAKMKLVER